MTEPMESTESPAMQKLTELSKEFASHKERVGLRAEQVSKNENMSPEIKELFLELSQTVLSLQGDLIDGVREAFAELPGDEAVSMLLSEDADIIGVVIEDYQEMLNGMISDANYASMLPQLKQKLTEAGAALKLIEEITVDDGAPDDETGEETEDGEEGEEQN